MRRSIFAYLAIVAAAIAVAVISFNTSLLYLQQFPRTYSWSDMMINYHGGFIRRGLLGEIALHINSVIPAKWFFYLVIVGSYVVVLAGIIRMAASAGLLAGLMFILSPAGLLFFVNDPVAFGRKDIVIMAAFTLAWFTAKHLPVARAVLLTIAIYLVAALIIESAIVFFPAAMALVLLQNDSTLSRSEKLFAYLLTACIVICAALLLHLNNHSVNAIGEFSATQRALIEAWTRIYPEAFPERFAVQWLGWPLKEGFFMAINLHMNPVSLAGYSLALSLALVPACLAIATASLRQSPETRVFVTVAAISTLAMFVLAADWGRDIVLVSFHLFGIAVFYPRSALPEAKQEHSLVIGVLVLVLFTGTWKLRHFDAFLPGALFERLRVSDSQVHYYSS